MTKNKITIAIDGYSSTGKSSFSKAIAKRLGYIYVDTGAMYRAVTLYCIDNGLIGEGGFPDTPEIIRRLSEIKISFAYNNETGKSDTMLNGVNVETDIRGIEVSQYVSSISAIPEVRGQMVELQREMGKHGGLVMDGRDIGTVVFPNADLKIFMTADPRVRAIRRFKELEAKGKNVSLKEIEKNISHRDYEDSHRTTSPLRRAEDAVVLDNSNMTLEEQLQWFDLLFSKVVGATKQ
ncbi:MAG: (d)CMP kinase [Prevotellaceae bacterium]|jgi:cytidylate kinase|nr:(d)CMP kinase [Prevotellaceae bacterium]